MDETYYNYELTVGLKSGGKTTFEVRSPIIDAAQLSNHIVNSITVTKENKRWVSFDGLMAGRCISIDPNEIVYIEFERKP